MVDDYPQSVPLYDLLPLIVRMKATFDAQGGQSVFQGIVSVLENLTGLMSSDIEGLANLIDADLTDPSYLSYLTASLGTLIGSSDRGVSFDRWLAKNLVSFHKIKGTHPSWGQQVQWLLSLWRDGWELWKTIPNEIGDYQRFKTYTNLMKSARFDFYDGTEWLTNADGSETVPSAAAIALLPFIESIRPIHVLLRTYGEQFVFSETMPEVSEAALLNTYITVSETVGGVGSKTNVDVTCTNSCEHACEIGCETGCETFLELYGCQWGCQVGSEVPNSPTPQDCTIACHASCEAGGCEVGCQVGSCQAGCQSCTETEIYPACISYTGATDASMSGYNTSARVWQPMLGQKFPPTEVTQDSWEMTDPWIHASGEGTTLSYNIIDPKAHFSTSLTDRSASTLLPSYIKDDWLWVRCVRPPLYSEVLDDTNGKPDGRNITWRGKCKYHPHPCSVRLTAEKPDHNDALLAAAKMNTQIIYVNNASADFVAGDMIRIIDDNNSESNAIVSITGDSMMRLLCPLQHGYNSNPYVFARGSKQVVFSADMAKPIDASTWKSIIGGDYNHNATSWFNYRDTYDFNITFRNPPKSGSTLTLEYYPEIGPTPPGCVYSLLETPQPIWLARSPAPGGSTFPAATPNMTQWVGTDTNGRLVHGGPLAVNSTFGGLSYDAAGHMIGTDTATAGYTGTTTRISAISVDGSLNINITTTTDTWNAGRLMSSATAAPVVLAAGTTC
jgi:hypothetical protein